MMPFVLDGDRIVDQLTFVAELRRVGVPLDPPLASGRSPNAIADSLAGGFIAAGSDAALLWDNAWVLRSGDRAAFDLLVEMLTSVQSDVALPIPQGGSVSLTVLLAVRAHEEEE